MDEGGSPTSVGSDLSSSQSDMFEQLGYDDHQSGAIKAAAIVRAKNFGHLNQYVFHNTASGNQLHFCPLARFCDPPHNGIRCLSLKRGDTFTKTNAFKVHIENQHPDFAFVVGRRGAAALPASVKKQNKKSADQKRTNARRGTTDDRGLVGRQQTIFDRAYSLKRQHPGVIAADLAADLGELAMYLRSSVPSAADALGLDRDHLYRHAWSFVLTDPLGFLPALFRTYEAFHSLDGNTNNPNDHGFPFFDLRPEAETSRRPPWASDPTEQAWLSNRFQAGTQFGLVRRVNIELLALMLSLKGQRPLPPRPARKHHALCRTAEAVASACDAFRSTTDIWTFLPLRRGDVTNDPQGDQVARSTDYKPHRLIRARDNYLATMVKALGIDRIRIPPLVRSDTETAEIVSSILAHHNFEASGTFLSAIRIDADHLAKSWDQLWSSILEAAEATATRIAIKLEAGPTTESTEASGAPAWGPSAVGRESAVSKPDQASNPGLVDYDSADDNDGDPQERPASPGGTHFQNPGARDIDAGSIEATTTDQVTGFDISGTGESHVRDGDSRRHSIPIPPPDTASPKPVALTPSEFLIFTGATPGQPASTSAAPFLPPVATVPKLLRTTPIRERLRSATTAHRP